MSSFNIALTLRPLGNIRALFRQDKLGPMSQLLVTYGKVVSMPVGLWASKNLARLTSTLLSLGRTSRTGKVKSIELSKELSMAVCFRG